MKGLAVALAILLAVAFSVVLAQGPEISAPYVGVAVLEERVEILEHHIRVEGRIMAYRGEGGWIERLETVFDSLIVPVPSPSTITSTIAFHYRADPEEAPIPLPASFRLYDKGRLLSTILTVPKSLHLGPNQRFYVEITSDGHPVAMMKMNLPGYLSHLTNLPYEATLH